MILDPAYACYQNHICCPKGISLKPRLNQTWPFSMASAVISFSFNVKLQPLLDLCHVESSGSGGTFGLRLFLHFPVKTVHMSPTMSDDAFPAEWLENSNIPSPEKDTHTLSAWPGDGGHQSLTTKPVVSLSGSFQNTVLTLLCNMKQFYHPIKSTRKWMMILTPTNSNFIKLKYKSGKKGARILCSALKTWSTCVGPHRFVIFFHVFCIDCMGKVYAVLWNGCEYGVRNLHTN